MICQYPNLIKEEEEEKEELEKEGEAEKLEVVERERRRGWRRSLSNKDNKGCDELINLDSGEHKTCSSTTTE